MPVVAESLCRRNATALPFQSARSDSAPPKPTPCAETRRLSADDRLFTRAATWHERCEFIGGGARRSDVPTVGGENVTTSALFGFFARKWKIALLAALTYAALC